MAITINIYIKEEREKSKRFGFFMNEIVEKKNRRKEE